MRERRAVDGIPGIAVDRACLLSLALFFGLTLLSAPRVPEWRTAIRNLALAGAAFAAAVWAARRSARGSFAMVVRTGAVLLVVGVLFQEVRRFQLVLVGRWMDGALLRVEEAVLGTEASLLLDRITTPVLTEWMMFAYVGYVALLPVTAFLCWRSGGERAANDYLFHLVLANLVCYLGFIAFPLAGPLYHHPDLYTRPLAGGLFTWCGEWIRANEHYIGGSLPSPHCAVATVMLAMFFRYRRRLFLASLPFFLTLYVSTVYGRYHYASDVLAGILAAFAVLKGGPRLLAWTGSIAAAFRRLALGKESSALAAGRWVRKEGA